jgi:ParB/RepB/Spo0J family partition protein
MPKSAIADITVGDRHRQDMGDLEELADSIKRQGVLQPIGVTADDELVFGKRRLLACRDILGWDTIDCRVVDVTSLVEGEHDENLMRKDFTLSERHAIHEGPATCGQLSTS